MPNKTAEERDWLNHKLSPPATQFQSTPDRTVLPIRTQDGAGIQNEPRQIKVSTLLVVVQFGPRCTVHFSEPLKITSCFLWEVLLPSSG